MEKDKKSLRIKYRALRKGVENKKEKDVAIYNVLAESDLYKNADRIMFYISMADEVDTKHIINRAFADGKSVFVPKVISKTEMKACQLTGNDVFEKSTLGVAEPENPVFADGKDMDLIIVPGLAFSKAGVRLGFGGGYYDRYLKDLKCYTVGLCYESCLADDLVKEEYDVNVKYIITEKGIVCCGG